MISGSEAIEVDELFPHPIEAIWAALTDSKQLADWFMANDFRPEVGHRFTLDTGRWGSTRCQVTDVEPPHLLRYTWRNADLDTVVTWRLSQEDGGTRLVLAHSGFRMPEQGAAFGGMSAGWRSLVFAELREHLAGRR